MLKFKSFSSVNGMRDVELLINKWLENKEDSIEIVSHSSCCTAIKNQYSFKEVKYFVTVFYKEEKNQKEDDAIEQKA